tara:strand:- start:279 stop:431 length:153 start_codon:yes stop_codon:yes gene_type:complete
MRKIEHCGFAESPPIMWSNAHLAALCGRKSSAAFLAAAVLTILIGILTEL